MSPELRSPTDYAFRGAEYLALAGLLAVIVVPFLFIVSVSFRPSTEFYSAPHLIPYNPTLEPWKQAIDGLGGKLLNSFYVAVGTAALSLLITIPGAYAFGRTDFPGKKYAFYLILAALLFPYIILIIPLQSIWYDIGLFNTIPGLWIGYQTFVTPFSIWILRDFFRKLPENLEEAAQVYGCTQFTAFARVILPLSMPAVMSVGFLAFLVGWSDFLFANMLIFGGPETAVVRLYENTTGGEQTFWARLMAQSLLIGAPPAILYMVARRNITNAFAVR